MRYSSEDSELIIDGDLLTNDRKSLYRVTVTVSDYIEDDDSESSLEKKVYEIQIRVLPNPDLEGDEIGSLGEE